MTKQTLEPHLGSWIYNLPDESVTELASIFAHLKEVKEQVQIFPEQKNIFRAFKETPYENVKVVVLGQDVYYNEVDEVPVANGLCFSINENIKDPFFIPPSLRNILSEVETDTFPAYFNPERLSLTYKEAWGERLAKQGVFLLNTALTVERNKPEAHCELWSKFTTQVIETLAKKETPIVWMLFGKFAHAYEKYIPKHHMIIKTSHPSPLGAHKQGKDYPAFIGSRCFSTCNMLLEESGQTPIEW